VDTLEKAIAERKDTIQTKQDRIEQKVKAFNTERYSHE
jgi:hypothetical protein